MSNVTPYKLAPIEVGRRLRVARKCAGYTQEEVSQKLAITRSTLIAMEKGQRTAKFEELLQLCTLYATTPNALLRKEAIHVELVPQFRQLQQPINEAEMEAVHILRTWAKAEAELEDALNVSVHQNYPPERLLLPGNVRKQAEQDAQELRDWLGRGSGPIPDILSLLEMDIGIRVYVAKLASHISGLYFYHDDLGACMLFNASHPPQRRAYSAAHELGHFISTRRGPQLLVTDDMLSNRAERYANHFAQCFLMPARAVGQRFMHMMARETPCLTRRHVILLADLFGVSREAMVRRLENLELAPRGSWEWFKQNGGITAQQVEEVLGAQRQVRCSTLVDWKVAGGFPVRLAWLAAEALRESLYSEGQLAVLLDMDRIELRTIVTKYGAEDGVLDDRFLAHAI